MAAPIPRKEWRENIRKNYDYLIRELEVKNMLPGLYQNKVINGRELEELEVRQTEIVFYCIVLYCIVVNDIII